MNIMSQMCQWSQGSEHPTSKDPRPSSESGPTSIDGSQTKSTIDDIPAANVANVRRSSVASASMSPMAQAVYVNFDASGLPGSGGSVGMAEIDADLHKQTITFTNQWLGNRTPFNQRRIVKNLAKGMPVSTDDYAEHLYKVACLLYDGELSYDEINRLERKYLSLTAVLDEYSGREEDPSKSSLYLVVEKCFDVFIKMAMDVANMWLASHTIRFLTTVMMKLNYWELYHLLRVRPVIYPFLVLIGLDLNERYMQFITDYDRFNFEQDQLSRSLLRRAAAEWKRRRGSTSDYSSDEEGSDAESSLHTDPVLSASPASREKGSRKKQRKSDLKLVDRRVIPKSEHKAVPSTRSSNYDPDVVHECQLPSPEDQGKVCLRRFSRKYELIRHQETVHSKKKKLFKCYVCVKQDPSQCPRIFTRHDTLAKHIRVNHRISGKEAKAEVAFSKKHAEIVEEGDITVQVGRRKTKVDFELRAHMDKKGDHTDTNGSVFYRNIDESAPDSIHSGDEGLC